MPGLAQYALVNYFDPINYLFGGDSSEHFARIRTKDPAITTDDGVGRSKTNGRRLVWAYLIGIGLDTFLFLSLTCVAVFEHLGTRMLMSLGVAALIQHALNLAGDAMMAVNVLLFVTSLIRTSVTAFRRF